RPTRGELDAAQLSRPGRRRSRLGTRASLRSEDADRGDENEKCMKSSSAGESHPHALTDPDVNLSAHPAPIVQPQAVPPSANAQRGAAAVGQSARANGSLGADGLSASCISAWPI